MSDIKSKKKINRNNMDDDKLLELRTTITISNINQLYYTSSKGALSFRHIWNHIIVMLQHPLSFIIYEKKKKRYKHYFTVNKDPLSIDRFAKLKKKLTQKEIDSCAFQIFDSRYYIFLISVYNASSKNKEVRHLRPIRNCKWISDNHKTDAVLDDIAKQVHSVFYYDGEGAKEDYSLKSKTFRKFVESSIERLLEEPEKSVDDYRSKVKADDNLVIANKAREKLNLYKKVLLEDERVVQSLVDETVVSFASRNNAAEKEGGFLSSGPKTQGYLDRVYKKVNGGLLSLKKDDGARLPNISLYISDCVGGSGFPRCNNEGIGVYNYGLGLYLVNEQEEEIRKFFTNTLKSKEFFLDQYERYNVKNMKGQNPLLFSDLCINVNEDEAAITQDCLSYADTWFWDSLGNLYGRSIDDVIDVLKAPFGENLRSVCDATLWNSTVHIAYPFLEGGGIKRCFGGSKDQKMPENFTDIRDSVLEDIKKICVTYYYFRGVMPDEVRQKLDKSPALVSQITLLMVGLELQGNMYAVCAHFGFIPHDQVADESWHKVVDIYNAVDQKVKRSFRKTMKELYMEIVNATFTYNYTQVISKIFQAGNFDLQVIQERLNQGFDTVEYLMPFRTVEFKLYFLDEYIKENETDVLPEYKESDFIKKYSSKPSDIIDLDKLTYCEGDGISVGEFKERLSSCSFPLFPGLKNIHVVVKLNDNKHFPVTGSKNRPYLRSEEVAFSLLHQAQLCLISYRRQEVK